jgi:hypothetical protein
MCILNSLVFLFLNYLEYVSRVRGDVNNEQILHTPTFQQIFFEASSNLENIPADLEALMFAIYYSAVNSIQDDECQNILGESKADILARYSISAEQALINAKLLKTSNIVVLQAFTLYLVCTLHMINAYKLVIGSPSLRC